MNATPEFDVFISYTALDYAVVEHIACALKERGLTIFIDRWELAPGRAWPLALEEHLQHCNSAIIALGPSGMGSWQQREHYLALDRQARDADFAVIPVILPDADPALGFLSLNTWVDLRHSVDEPESMDLLAAAIRGHAPAVFLDPSHQAIASICPYRGLEVFREEDAPLFFGRDAFTKELQKAVATQPLVAVVGRSGSGKSSVVRAGLLPSLRRTRNAIVWEISTLVPGKHPLHTLAGAVLPLLEPEMSETDRLIEINKQASYLADGSLSLSQIVNRVLEKQPGTDRLLLFVDQWEELYTYANDVAAKRDVNCFVDQLLSASAASPFTVVLTLRADFYADALRHRGLADRLRGAAVNLGPMVRNELEFAVTQPAEKLGLSFDTGLVDRILNDVGDEPGNLPLMEFTLKALWEARKANRLLYDTYKSVGGVQGAIARRAENVYEKLDPSQQKLAERIFTQLVRPGDETGDTRRRAGFDEFDIEGQNLLRTLAGKESRLLVAGRDLVTHADTVEVAHEALIQRWDRLRGWIDANREVLQIRERVEVRAKTWQDDGEPNDRLLAKGREVEEGRQLIAESASLLPDDVITYIRRSTSHHIRQGRRLTWTVTGLIFVLLVSLGLTLSQWQTSMGLNEELNTALMDASQQKEQALVATEAAIKAETVALNQALEANFNLAKFYEEKAMRALADGRDGGSTNNFREAWLYAAEAALLPIPEGKQALSSETVGAFLVGNVTRDAFNEQWTSPSLDLVGNRYGTGFRKVAFSPDGQLIATGHGAEPPKRSPESEHPIYIWDAASGDLLQRLEGHTLQINDLEFSSDSQRLISVSHDGSARIWDSGNGRLLHIRETKKPIYAATFHPKEEKIFLGSQSGLYEWRTDQKQALLISKESIDPKPPGGVANNKKGEKLIPGTVLWVNPGGIHSLDIDSEAELLAVGGIKQAQIGSLESGELVRNLRIEEGNNSVFRVAFSPDGILLATAPSSSIVHVWDVNSGELKNSLEYGGTLGGMAFNRDGTLLATAANDKKIRIWDPQSGKLLKVIGGHGEPVSDVAFNPKNDWLFSVSGDRTVRVWDANTGASIDPGVGHWGEISSVDISGDGKTIASASWDNTARLWDVQSGSLKQALIGHQDRIYDIAFDPKGNRIITGSRDGTARLWDTESASLLQTLSIDDQPVVSVDFSPDGATFAAGSAEGTVNVWSAESGELLKSFGGRSLRATIKYSPLGDMIAKGGRESGVHIFDSATGKLIKTLEGHRSWVVSLAFDPAGRILATGDSADDGKSNLRLWNIGSGELLHALDTGPWVDSIAFSPDGRLVAVPERKQVQVFDVVSGKPMRAVNAGCPVTSIGFTPNERSLVVGCSDKTVRLLDVSTSSLESVLNEPAYSIGGITFSPDDRHLAVWGINNSVSLKDIHAEGPDSKFPVYGSAPWSVVFSPDRQKLAIGSSDRTISVWDANSGALKHRFAGNSYSRPFVLSPDGELVAVLATGNRSLHLWDVKEGRLRYTLQGHTNTIDGFDFSPDGQTVATASFDKAVRLWNSTTGDPGLILDHDDKVSQIAFNIDGQTLLAFTTEALYLWDFNTGLLKHRLELDDYVDKAAFSPDGKLLVAGRRGGRKFWLWNIDSGAQTGKFEVGGQLNILTFIPDSALLVAGTPLRVFDTNRKTWLGTDELLTTESFPTRKFALHDGGSGLVLFDPKVPEAAQPLRWISSGSVSPDGQQLASGSEDHTVGIFDLQSERIIQATGQHSGYVEKFAFAQTGNTLITQHRGRSVQLWDIESGKLIHSTNDHGRGTSEGLQSVAFSPDGLFLVSVGPDAKVVHILDATDGSILHRLSGHIQAVTALAFSPDGRSLASASREAVRLWDVKSGKLAEVLEATDTLPVRQLEFSKSGSKLAWSTGYNDGEVHLWDLESAAMKVLAGNGAIEFSPDGRILATDAGKNSVKLWDAETGNQIFTLPGRLYESEAKAFDSGGKVIATKSARNTVSLWDVGSGQKFRDLPGDTPFGFSTDGRELAVGSNELGKVTSGVKIWPFQSRLLPLLGVENNQQRTILQYIKQAAEFLWQRKVQGQTIVPNLRRPKLFPQNGYYFKNEVRIRPLLNPPGPQQSKFDQVYQWAEEQKSGH